MVVSLTKSTVLNHFTFSLLISFLAAAEISLKSGAISLRQSSQNEEVQYNKYSAEEAFVSNPGTIYTFVLGALSFVINRDQKRTY